MTTGWLKALFWCLAALLFAAGPALADQVEMTVAGDPPWVIRADEITALPDQDLYLIEGNVRFTRGTETITADRVRYHDESRTAEIRGNVVVASRDFKLVCRQMILNLDYYIGKAYSGTVYFPANHYYISGDEVERTGPDTFVMLQGRITTCDGPYPAWSITGEDITIEREGYATAHNAKFETRYVPVLYSPWLRVPVKQERQTGLLLPGVRSSDRDGFTYAQPFFWAISDSKDMTITLTAMGDRGLETAAEFRYKDWGGEGTFQANYLSDQDPPTIEYPEPDGPEVVEDRYWIRGLANKDTDSGFNFKLDLDVVSDPDYLREFNSSYTGFQETREVFIKDYGRQLNEPRDPLRDSQLQVTKSINSHSAKMIVKYTEDLEDPQNIDTVQRLPRLGLDLSRLEIPGTPLYFKNTTDYNYFYRRTNEDSQYKETGHRLDMRPRVYWPLKIRRYLDLEPSAGFRETAYLPHGIEEDERWPDLDESRNDRLNTRELYDFEIEAATNLYRIFDLGLGRVRKIKHRFRPDVTYEYIPDLDQDDMPYFDSYDRIKERERITYGVNNYLVAKVGREAYPRALSENGSPAGNNGNFAYYDFLRLGVHRTYDLVEARRELVERRADLPEDFHQVHGPWEFELELDARPWLWAQASSEFDSYDEEFLDHSLESVARDWRGDYLKAEYELHLEPSYKLYSDERRKELEYEEIHGLLNVALNYEWDVQYEKRYNLADSLDIETFYAVQYHPPVLGGAAGVHGKRGGDGRGRLPELAGSGRDRDHVLAGRSELQHFE